MEINNKNDNNIINVYPSWRPPPKPKPNKIAKKGIKKILIYKKKTIPQT